MNKILTLIICTQISNLYSLDKVVTVIKPGAGVIITTCAAAAGGVLGSCMTYDEKSRLENMAGTAVLVSIIPACMVYRRSPQRVLTLTKEAFDKVSSSNASILAKRPESFKELTPVINKAYVNSPVPLGKFQHSLIKKKMAMDAIQAQLKDEYIAASSIAMGINKTLPDWQNLVMNRLTEMQQYPEVTAQSAIFMQSKAAKDMKDQLDSIETSIMFNTMLTAFKR